MIRNTKRTVIILLLGVLGLFCGVTLHINQLRLIAIPAVLKDKSFDEKIEQKIRTNTGKSDVLSNTTILQETVPVTAKTESTTAKISSENLGKAKRDDDLQLNDIYISVKTCGRFHKTRVPIILNTWWTQAKEQIYFFTDIDDASLNNFTNGHTINTHCNNTHTRSGLSCKMESEYSFGLKMNKKWWCHFDDDNYVNIEQLVNLLRNYSSDEDHYLGRLSWVKKQIAVRYNKGRVPIDFATGGAGVCISRKTTARMIPLMSNGKFQEISDKIGQSDDVALGFVVYHQLGINMTKVDGFHSHIEKLNLLPSETLKYQVSVGYTSKNTIVLKNPVFPAHDHSKFYSLHCEIHPDIDWCVKKTIPPLIKTS